MKFIKQYLKDTKSIIDQIDSLVIENMVSVIKSVQLANGRIFFIGVGGT